MNKIRNKDAERYSALRIHPGDFISQGVFEFYVHLPPECFGS